VLLFANPIAGMGRGKRIAAALRRTLADRGFDVRPFLEPPESVPENALRDAGDIAACISIGGDGTLRGVVQRMHDVFGLDRMPPMVVVPLGTANLMSKHLASKWDEAAIDQQVAEAIEQQKILTLDAATANGKLFLLMAGVGFDAHIIHELDRSRTGPIDITSYALPAALALQSYSYSPLEVEIEGQRAFGPAPALVFVGNVREYGTGFPVLPLARSDDGVLDVCVMPCASRVDVLRLLILVATGDHIRAEGVIYTTATHVKVTSSDSVPIQIDGESAGHTPLEIRMLLQRIPFIVR
jgi:YegS/Rv2252/BmrU family lipid kinase